MSKFNGIGWTKKGHSEKCTSNSEQSRTLVIPRPNWWRKMVRNAHVQTWRKIGFHLHRDGGTFHSNWSPSIQGHQCFESCNSEKKRWQMYDRLQCGFVEHRTLVSHNSLSKSAQSLRSSVKMVWRVRSMDSESKRVVCGDFRGKRKWAATEKCEAARSEFLGVNSKERKSGIWKQIARMSSEIWNTGERNPIHESLWRCGIYEKNLSWDELQNYSWRRWLFWRPNLSLQRIHTLPREGPNSRIHATIPRQTTIGPGPQVHITRYLDTSGFEIQIPSTAKKDLKTWVVIIRGVEELRLNESDHNPASSELLEHIELERSILTKREHGSPEMQVSWNSEKTHAKQLQIQWTFWRSFFHWRKEVEWYSCLSSFPKGFQRKCFWSRSLEIGYEICTPLWSRRKGNRRSRSSDLVDKGNSTCILRFRKLMENQLSSSGIFSQDLLHWRSSENFWKNCKNKKLNVKILKIESFSCRCSMILVGREEEIRNIFSNSEHVKNFAKKITLGPRSEKKWFGKSNYPPDGKWQDTANMMVEQFEESGHSVFKGVSPLACGILRKKNNKGDHTLQCGYFEHKTFISNNSLRRMVWRFWCEVWWKASENYKWWFIERSSTKRSDLFGKSTKECSARSWKQSEVQQNFETLGTEVQFTKLCKEAAFIHEVAVGRFYRTVLDVDDGIGDRTPVSREYTSVRVDSDSVIFAAIKQRKIIGPVVVYIYIYICLQASKWKEMRDVKIAWSYHHNIHS